MTDALLLVLMAAIGGMLIVVLAVVAFRLAGERGASVPPMAAAYRAEPGEAWRRGTLRVVSDRLVLKGPGGLAAGPWQRGNLDLGVSGPLPLDEARVLGKDHLIQVPVTYGTSTFELVLGEQHYTALRAWVEAAPPGWNSQLA